MLAEQETKTILNSAVKKRCVLYARTSSGDKKTDSLPSQLSVCETYANEQGYIIVDKLSEDIMGVKGDDRNAPALNKALEMAQAGLYDVLIIRDVKRFSRDVYKAMDFEGRFFDTGINIEYPWNRELNGLPRRGTGFVMRFLQYWMSEEDRKHIVSKLYYKRVERVRDRNNVMVHGRPPYGYDEKIITENGKDRRVLVINEAEAKWVRKMFEWYVIGGVSLRAIQRKLKEKCVPRPSEHKKFTAGNVKGTGQYDWGHTSVKLILTRKAYTGLWTYGKSRPKHREQNSIIADELTEPITVEVPIIIDQALFKAAQERLLENKKRTHKKSKYKFLMRGRVRCGLCGSACGCEASKRYKSYRIYRCVIKKKPNDPANFRKCNLPVFKRDVIDYEVWQWLTDLMDDDKELKKGYQEYLDLKKNEVQPLQAELKRIDDNLKELQERLTSQAQAVKMLADIGSTIATDSLKTEILQTEDLITRNKNRRGEIEAELKTKAVDVDIITDFDSFVSAARIGIKKAHGRFDKKLEVIKAMNVTVELTVENNEPKYIARCILKPNNTEARSCTSVFSPVVCLRPSQA